MNNLDFIESTNSNVVEKENLCRFQWNGEFVVESAADKMIIVNSWRCLFWDDHVSFWFWPVVGGRFKIFKKQQQITDPVFRTGSGRSEYLHWHFRSACRDTQMATKATTKTSLVVCGTRIESWLEGSFLLREMSYKRALFLPSGVLVKSRRLPLWR